MIHYPTKRPQVYTPVATADLNDHVYELTTYSRMHWPGFPCHVRLVKLSRTVYASSVVVDAGSLRGHEKKRPSSQTQLLVGWKLPILGLSALH